MFCLQYLFESPCRVILSFLKTFLVCTIIIVLFTKQYFFNSCLSHLQVYFGTRFMKNISHKTPKIINVKIRDLKTILF